MADEKNLPFKERAYENYQEEIKNLEKVAALLSMGKETEEVEEYCDPLSIEERKEITILLSWGGPSDGYRLYIQDGEVIEGFYFFADWFEYEQYKLSSDELDLVLSVYPIEG